METEIMLMLSAQERIERLKVIRRALGWSEETCAHHIGVAYSTFNRWERGRALPKSRAVLRAIDRFIARYGKAHTSIGGDENV